MLTLVTGGAASGKSEYAERLAAACDGPRVYIATMRPLDKESVARIEKHRAARADRRFSTIERYHDLKGLRLPCGTNAVLLECMSVIKPSVIPHLSFRTFAIGAKQLVVQEALETN